MGSFLYFLVLAIVTLTGRAAASSHASRRRILLEAPEKIDMQVFDEKQALKDSLQDDGESSPSLPMFRIRRSLLGSGTFGLLEGSLKEKEEKEDIVEKRRKLKESLRVIIPSGEVSLSHYYHYSIQRTHFFFAISSRLRFTHTSAVNPFALRHCISIFSTRNKPTPTRARPRGRIPLPGPLLIARPDGTCTPLALAPKILVEAGFLPRIAVGLLAFPYDLRGFQR